MTLIGYAYIAKGSGALVLCDAKHKDLPHVFPIYRNTKE